MTFYKELAMKTNEKRTVTAYERYEKYETYPTYVVCVSNNSDSLAFIAEKTARTTWKKKFNQLCAEWL